MSIYVFYSHILTIKTYIYSDIFIVAVASKTKTREITITDEDGAFSVFFKKITGENKAYDFEGLGALRQLLSNERAKILHILRVQKPKSIYELAKKASRDFKSVSDDIKLLERFGFVQMVSEKTGKRARLRPILVIDSMNIVIKF